ncbi:Pregnancy-associated plasma protein-A [compost metagenome]
MKRKITLNGMALAVLLSVSFVSQAQNQPKPFGRFSLTPDSNGIIKCASAENEILLQEQNPNRPTTAQFEQWMAEKIEEGKEKRTPKSGNAIITIPVIVHVIHNGDAVGSNENIPQAQIERQIEILNEDFGAMVGTAGENVTGWGGDTEIRFCLATLDQDGNTLPFPGVDRYPDGLASYTNKSDIETVKGFTQWDPEKYYNIWVLNMNINPNGGTLLGYAQFPSYTSMPGLGPGQIGPVGESFTDGVAIKYQYFGGNSRTTTHETGHFLGLRHIWGDKENTCIGEDDYCADTPNAAAANNSCIQNDSCPEGDPDMIENYMDYTPDSCMSVFTPNQKTRMRTILQNAVRRANLATSNVCGTASSQEFQFLMGTNIYPNPTQNELTISVGSENLPDSYSIYNSLGQTMANVSSVTEANLTINTSAYSNGIYFIKIDKGAESRTIKFVKN